MANMIVKDSGLAIFVKETQVPANTKVNTLVLVGGKRGLAGFDALLGEDGKWYTTVDTAAHIKVEGVAVAFTDGAPVYATPAGAITATASGNTLIGYADREKSAAAGPLHLQLVPGATTA